MLILRRKDPRELTEEELVKYLEDPSLQDNDSIDAAEYEQEKSGLYHQDLAAFLKHFNIFAGDKPISWNTLKKMYSMWSKRKNNLWIFKQIFKDLLPEASTTNSICYINADSFTLSKSLFLSIRTQKYVRKYTKPMQGWSHFSFFLRLHKITHGEYRINARAINWIYVGFSKGLRFQRMKPLEFYKFKSFCRVKFKTEKENDELFCYVNGSILQYFKEEGIDTCIRQQAEREMYIRNRIRKRRIVSEEQKENRLIKRRTKKQYKRNKKVKEKRKSQKYVLVPCASEELEPDIKTG